VREIMRRISELKAMRWVLVNNKMDPELLPAAIDWIDMTIAEHEADLEAIIKRIDAA